MELLPQKQWIVISDNGRALVNFKRRGFEPILVPKQCPTGVTIAAVYSYTPAVIEAEATEHIELAVGLRLSGDRSAHPLIELVLVQAGHLYFAPADIYCIGASRVMRVIIGHDQYPYAGALILLL